MSDKSSMDISNTAETATPSIIVVSAGCCLFIALVVGCVLIYYGSHYIKNDPNQDSIPVNAIISTCECNPYFNYSKYGSKTKYICNMTVSYTIEGKSYTSSNTIKTDSDVKYNVGQNINVRVSKSNYNSVRLDDIPSNAGIGLIIVGIVLMLCCSANFWGVRKFPLWGFIFGACTCSRFLVV